MSISVIIPIAPEGEEIKALLNDLKYMPDISEIILAIAENLPEKIASSNPNIKIIKTKKGRAVCQNMAAAEAKGDYLWFLHADSRISKSSLSSLKNSLDQKPDSLHYFNLRFLSDGPPLMIINEWGTKLRCLVTKTPFGDQGFCIKRELFDKIGGFPENVEYGEDHLFTWRAKQSKISLNAIKADLITSARKYKKYGWLKLTLKYQYLWIKQAYPQWLKLIKTTR